MIWAVAKPTYVLQSEIWVALIILLHDLLYYQSLILARSSAIVNKCRHIEVGLKA